VPEFSDYLDILAGKFRRSPTGEIKEWGLKVFP